MAYTQGTQIHVGSGQEQHLAHEAWHVVQQKQGRVQPTVQTGAAINNDAGLEKEADMMGKAVREGGNTSLQHKAIQTKTDETPSHSAGGSPSQPIIQRVAANIPDRVSKIIVDQLGVDKSKLVSSASFVEDLGADPLDQVELIMALEQEFNLQISDEDAETITTLGKTTAYLERKLGEKKS